MQAPKSIDLSGASPPPRPPLSPRAFTGPLQATGKGVGVAVFDTGVYPHPDLDQNLVACLTTRQEGRPDSDWKGHGTAVAGVIASNGKTSLGKNEGVAPNAQIINVQTMIPERDQTPPEAVYSGVLDGMQWVLENREKFNIKVINMSGGVALIPQMNEQGQLVALRDPLADMLKKINEAGITVIAAAGNAGEPGTVDRSPGVNPTVITVGALDTNGTPQDLSDDKRAGFSSHTTPDGRAKPDLLAPGVGIMCPAVPHSEMMVENDNRAALVKQLGEADGKELIGVVLQKIAANELYFSAVKRSAEAIKQAMMRNLGEASRAHLEKKQALSVMTLAAAFLKKNKLPEEAFKDELAQLRTELIENLQPRKTQFFLEDGNPAYIAVDGTSFAAPMVAGVAADMYELKPDLKPEQVKQILIETASPIAGDPTPVLNAQAALDAVLKLG